MKFSSSLAFAATILSLISPILANYNEIAIKNITVLTHRSAADVAPDVQALFDTMNGTFALPDYFGPDAYVSEIYLTNSTDDLPDGDFLNFGNSFTSTGTGLGKRYTEKVKSHSCTNPPQFADRLISYETQVKIAGKYCDWLADVSPYVYSLVAMKITKMRCGVDGSFVCTGFWGVAHTAAGSYIGPGIKAMCKPAYESLMKACDEKGGFEKVEITQTGKSFEVYSFANSEETETCSTAGKVICKVYNCDDSVGCSA
ncbi:uncharacterized protein N7484_004271 [Penicillium longicatenatum]|uniref:uncharacterized protein n=1 Tax=Penicillium longicatenatum TaxID=1561947 RepID=UPI002548294E|nr:uncharacterized protein N7484_004271 [Penicillium longicatenatum]KAJ5650548.1 hypothetical protein N7484_004271 [Penicillium longicatenatum]